MKKILRLLAILVAVVLVAIQFDALADRLPVIQKHKHLDRPADLVVDAKLALETVASAPDDVKKLLAVACNDCHAAKTEWPWYSYVAPMKWFVIEHVVAGRKKAMFAKFGEETSEDQAHVLEECVEVVEEKSMPLESYTWLHGDAKLSDADRKKLVDWFKAEAAKRKG